MKLTGYASTTETPYDMGWYSETVSRGAFKKTLAENPDVMLLLNHGGLPLARTKAGTLRLEEDGIGLKVDADLDPDDPDSQTLNRKRKRGDLDGQMSFAFTATRQAWNEDYTQRTITECNIHRGDVSVVNQGANPGTSAAMRSKAAAARSLDVTERRALAQQIGSRVELRTAAAEFNLTGVVLDLAPRNLVTARGTVLNVGGTSTRGSTLTPTSGGAAIKSEPLTYRRDNAHQRSYYADLALAQVKGAEEKLTHSTRADALARLQRHAAEMDVEIPKRVKAAEAHARESFENAEAQSTARRNGRGVAEARPLAYDPFQRSVRFDQIEQRVTPSRADGFGGYFVPPLWIPDQYIPGLRAQGVARDLCRQLDLPAGTGSVNIPKLANLTKVGYQQADNSGVVTSDWSDTFVQANVKTAAGQSDVPLQLLEFSPNGIVDEVITTDLMSAYDQFVDLQVIQGDGQNATSLFGGHILGIYPSTNWAGTNTVTYTDGSPSPLHMAQGVYGPLASKIARTRFDVEDFAVVMHGRRWFWYSTGNDLIGRPLTGTKSGGPMNSLGDLEALAAYGHVANLPFLADAPVYVDNNIPTNDTTGGGSGQDIAIAALWSDLWLFQGDLRTNVYSEVLSGSLSVRFQLHNYIAFLARYGQSVAIATGSGFAAPSNGYGDTF